MAVSCDVEKVLKKARDRAARAAKGVKEDCAAFSPGSSTTGLDPESKADTPPGKATFQKGLVGKRPLRTDSLATIVETPPPKRRSNSFDQGSASKLASSTAKDSTPKVKKGPPEEDDKASETTVKPSAKSKAKAKATKATSTKGKRAKEEEEEEEEEDEQPGTDHATAKSSKDTSPRKPKATTQQEGKKAGSPGKDPKEPKPKEPTDEEEEEDQEGKKKLAHKLYMRFWRNVHGRGPPKEIKRAYEASKYCALAEACKEKMSTLYDDFYQCKGKWSKSLVLKTIRSTSRATRRGTRRWLTEAQLLTLFGGDKEVVKSIILRKEVDEELRAKEIRHHPECPGLLQYLVLVEDEECGEFVDEISDMFQVEERGEEGDDSDSDGDSDSSDDDESSDRDAKKKDKKKQKKAINTLNRKIREKKGKLTDLAGLSKNLRKAVEQDMNDVLSEMTSARASLQAALDSGKEEKMTSETAAAQDVIDRDQNSLSISRTPKPKAKGGKK
ncbi:unnamed protein product [Symbiodinium sp. CCMP2592]|nr:unnamed protein product [Symbiodinium sp. CCMP2592]